MTVYFADTSALAKRYLPEIGSTWVRSWVSSSSGHIVVVSQLAIVEMFSLLERRTRDGSISALSKNVIYATFIQHAKTEYLVSILDDSILNATPSVISRHGLRSLDGIQLSCALDSASKIGQVLTFVSADVRLLAAAAAEGFATDNPNLHP